MGGMIYGMAGTGKSTTLVKIKQALVGGLLVGAFTHKAPDGNTLQHIGKDKHGPIMDAEYFGAHQRTT
eukprot:12764956-Prorocentrum_lima.AAC.1